MRARELGITAALALLWAVVLTWPLATWMGARLPYDPRFVRAEGADVHIFVWNLWWARTALETGSDPFFCERIFHPGGHTLALHTHTLLLGLFSTPLQWLFGVVFAYNALLLLSFAASATAVFALARGIGLSRSAAGLAAFAWAFSPYFVQKGLEHLNLFASPWPPLFVLACLRWMHAERPEPARAAGLAAGLVLGLALLTEMQIGLYSAVLGGLVFVLRPAGGGTLPRTSRRGLLFPSAWGLAVGALLLVSWPWIAAVSASWSALADTAAREQLYHPRLSDFVTPPGLHPLSIGQGAGAPLAGYAHEGVRNEDAGLYAGMGVLTLALLALVLAPRSRRWVGIALLLFLLAWDPGPDPRGWLANLYRHLPGLDLLRVPARAWPYALLALALAAGMGLDACLSRGRPGRALGALLCALVAAEWWVVGWPSTSARPPEAVRAIALTEDEGAVAFLPFTPGAHAAMTWQTFHEKPVLYSYVARSDPRRFLELEQRVPALFRFASGAAIPSPAALAVDLECSDVAHVLCDPRQLAEPALVFDVLDRMEGWERADTADEVAWWYSTARLTSADEALKHVRRDG